MEINRENSFSDVMCPPTCFLRSILFLQKRPRQVDLWRRKKDNDSVYDEIILFIMSEIVKKCKMFLFDLPWSFHCWHSLSSSLHLKMYFHFNDSSSWSKVWIICGISWNHSSIFKIFVLFFFSRKITWKIMKIFTKSNEKWK